MDDDNDAFETAALAVADGVASDDQLALLEADRGKWRRALERLLDETDEHLDVVYGLAGPERDQVVADFEGLMDRLEWSHDTLMRILEPEKFVKPPPPPPPPPLEPEEVRLQASWANGQIVVWAAGRGTPGCDNDELADRLEAIGGPPVGWTVHPDVNLPDNQRASALSISVPEALGWLAAAGGGVVRDGVGPSVTWLGRVALAAVRVVARGGVVPTLRSTKREGRLVDLNVKWLPALLDDAEISRLSASMPAPVVALAPSDGRAVVLAVIGAVVHAVVTEAASRLELPAPPPTTNTSAAVAEAFITRLDGSTFPAPPGPSSEVTTRLERWAKPVTGPAKTRLVVVLEPPDRDNAWFLTVLGPGADGNLLPVELAIADSRSTRRVADDLLRLERIYPPLLRPGGQRRGQVYLSQDEAWQLMTETGATLEAAGFQVRVPELSRRKAAPGLRMFIAPTGESVVGANQLSDVRWSVVVGDLELTAADVSRLASEARPLVRSHGKWVELDRADLKEAAAALAERASQTRMSGAEILRHAVGLEGTGLAGGLIVEGEGWATDLLAKAGAYSAEPVTEPEGFAGTLRSYQAEAVSWLGFLDAVGLGGCLALDMGLGKTPTVLAHLARRRAEGMTAKTLVIAPPAVVGNWAAEAARFTGGLKTIVHHGASRASEAGLAREVEQADLVITTYGTAVRDVAALEAIEWDRVVLDEAQAIKNHTNETAQQLRRIPARSRVALTGTPIENGLSDLWAILDYTNPGLVGSRAAFIAQLSGDSEAALRTLNGILVFRRTKSEPEVAAELPDRIDELDHCAMTPEQIGLYQAVLDSLVGGAAAGADPKQGAILAAITALKQICNHPAAYQDDDRPLAGRSGKLTRLEEIVETVFANGEKILIFTHFAEWGRKLATHLTSVTGVPIHCYHGGLARGARDKLVADFQAQPGSGALVLSLKAGGTGLNLTAASHVVLYDRWWNPAVEDQARDRAWRIGQTRTVVSHRLICPGTVDERVEEVVAGKRHIADLILPKSSSLSDLDANQLRVALGLRTDALLTEDDE